MRRVGGMMAAAVFAVALVAPAAAAERDETVKLSVGHPLAKGIDAMPRIVAPRTEAERRINRALAEIDAQARDRAAECREQAGSGNSSWTQKVAVTMRGPRLLSVVATPSWYCDTAYPDQDTEPHVFDLTTGAAVDWTKLFSGGTAKLSVDSDGNVSSDALTALYRKSAKPETVDPQCKEVIATTTLSFVLWPDAKAGGLVLQPSNLPHVIAACGVPTTIPTAALRSLGLNADLIDAIDAAHRVATNNDVR